MKIIKRLLLAALLALTPLTAQAVDDLWSYDATTPANNTNIGGVSMAEGMAPGLLNDGVRMLISQLKRATVNQGSDIASATTTNVCATGTSAYVKVTGTTTITGLGTAAAGCSRWITFTGALLLTHNGTSMILPGGANYTTVAGDVIWAVSEGSGNWRVRIFPAAGEVARHKLWIPAAALRPDAGTPPASADVAAGNVQYYVLDFDQTAVEEVWFNFSTPSSADETVALTFVPVWTAASGSGDVVWTVFCWARSNDDPITDAGFPTGATSTDTLIATGDLHRGPESSSITPDDTWAANDTLFCDLVRNGATGADTLNADARLIGIEVYMTTNAATDAP